MIDAREAITLRQEAAEIKKEWERGGEPDARAALDRLPELRADKSIVLDLAYEEYCLRFEAGRPPDLDAFCDRFPTFRLSVRRLVAAHEFLAQNIKTLTTAPPVRWPNPGDRLGDLTVLRELGRGAFARVYLAREESTGGRPVAVKLSAEGAAEACTMGRLAHPHVVPVLSARFEDAAGMIAVRMPFLGAATLTDLQETAYPTPDAPPPADIAVLTRALRAAGRRDDPAPQTSGAASRPETGAYVDGVARLALQIADALAFLHEEGVVHRDLKPSNVLLGPAGQAMLLDFNLSADARAAAPRLGGTLPYMAPEQLHALTQRDDAAALDGRVDLFALGVMVYELLTGKHPFGVPPAGQPPILAAPALRERQRKGCRPVDALNPVVGRRLARVVERCLAFDPDQRPASADVLATELRGCLSREARVRRWVAQRPWAAVAAVGLVLLAAGGAASIVASQEAADVQDYERGRNAYLEGRYEDAEEAFNQAVQDCPQDPKPRKYLMARGVAAMRLGEAAGPDNPQAAIPLLTNALLSLQEAEKQRPDGSTMALIGYCHSQVGDYKPALLWYDQAVTAGFQSAGLYNDRGLCHLNRNQLDDARRDLDKALEFDPTLQPALYNRAWLALKERPPVNPPPLPETLLDKVGQAVNSEPGSRDFYFTAARLFATAAQDGHGLDPKARASQALCCLQKAVAFGLDPKQIAGNPTFTSVLNPFPEYHQLLQSPPQPPGGPATTVQLIDPAPYLPE